MPLVGLEPKELPQLSVETVQVQGQKRQSASMLVTPEQLLWG